MNFEFDTKYDFQTFFNKYHAIVVSLTYFRSSNIYSWKWDTSGPDFSVSRQGPVKSFRSLLHFWLFYPKILGIYRKMARKHWRQIRASSAKNPRNVKDIFSTSVKCEILYKITKMASPKTRRVLAELRPKDENDVRVLLLFNLD